MRLDGASSIEYRKLFHCFFRSVYYMFIVDMLSYDIFNEFVVAVSELVYFCRCKFVDVRTLQVALVLK